MQDVAKALGMQTTADEDEDFGIRGTEGMIGSISASQLPKKSPQRRPPHSGLTTGKLF